MSPRITGIPVVTLLGRGFVSRRNLWVGWSLAWRVGLASGVVSAALHAGLALARGSLTLDIVDRVMLSLFNTLAGVLVTDWCGRVVARREYHLLISRFIGWALVWRELIAALTWGSVLGLLVGGGAMLVHVVTPDGSVRLIVGGGAVVALASAVMSIAGVGWAAHRVFALERARADCAEPGAKGLLSQVLQ